MRQCNFDGKNNENTDFTPKGGKQKVFVSAEGDVYGITVASGNALKCSENQDSVSKYFYQRYTSSYKGSTTTDSYFQRIPSEYHLHR